MSEQTLLTVIATITALLGGLFGQKLLDRWFDRDTQKGIMAGRRIEREFTDNEHARIYLTEQLDEQAKELKSVRDSERQLAAQVARLEERANAQAAQIALLTVAISEIRTERDEYRNGKREAEQEIHRLREQVAAMTPKLDS